MRFAPSVNHYPWVAVVIEMNTGRMVAFDIIPSEDTAETEDYAQDVAETVAALLESGQVNILNTNERIWDVARLSFYPNTEVWDSIEHAADIAEAQRELEELAY